MSNEWNNGAANGGYSASVALGSGATYNALPIIGFWVTAVGSANWSLTFADGSVQSIPDTALVLGDVYTFNLISITSGTGGTAVLFTG